LLLDGDGELKAKLVDVGFVRADAAGGIGEDESFEMVLIFESVFDGEHPTPRLAVEIELIEV
jgi:hypothetical protein